MNIFRGLFIPQLNLKLWIRKYKKVLLRHFQKGNIFTMKHQWSYLKLWIRKNYLKYVQ